MPIKQLGPILCPQPLGGTHQRSLSGLTRSVLSLNAHQTLRGLPCLALSTEPRVCRVIRVPARAGAALLVTAGWRSVHGWPGFVDPFIR